MEPLYNLLIKTYFFLFFKKGYNKKLILNRILAVIKTLLLEIKGEKWS